jgi:hypothetical protein
MKMLVILKNDIDGKSSIVPSAFTWTGDLDVVGHKDQFAERVTREIIFE